MTAAEYYTIDYEFLFPDGRKRSYEIRLDAERITVVPSPREADTLVPPLWTELQCSRCSICSLSADSASHCPIAVNIAELVEHFKRDESTEPITVRVTTPERVYLKETQVQYGLFSILGIIMATSGCPAMNFLKPMARFHLPFSTHMETMVRSISIYLLRQYFRKQSGGVPDIDLLELERKYQHVQKVNEGMLRRIREHAMKPERSSDQAPSGTASAGDAKDNAVLILHAFSQILSMEISQNLESLEYLFREE